MKFVIRRDRLVQAVNEVTRAITSRTTIPILTGIKMMVNDEGVTLTGSDSDISIEAFIPLIENDEVVVEVESFGGIVLQSKYFGDIVRRLPDENVEIEVTTNNQTTIRSGQAFFTLNGLDVLEYPKLPEVSDGKKIRIPINVLKNIIRQTVFAVSAIEVRPVLTGVNWIIKNNTLTAVATDSHRLALREIPLESEINEEYNIVIPGKSLAELNKILDDATESIEMVLANNQILFKLKDLLFYSRLLEGSYPDTSRLIPTDTKSELVINAKAFLQAIDRASLLARENRNNVIKLTTLENGQVEVSSNSPEIGNVSEKLFSQSFTGEELKISFNGKYMMDALRAFEGDDIQVSFAGTMRPFVIRPKDAANPNEILQLITPVRTY
ncbi:DNA polymerase III subunit beta [Listeria fleischmannii 1991]|jgi:DNA polymerase-3 subunit beta|uniref:Beta sliding clamp n=4 Tax=Listeria fleischmannii TaxID=1069827 RepID=A0A2X3HDD1_9LIST|nr:DNA polymerase III subunit beta [Listeria fleischmannii]EIA20558.1 DNA polymerase III subunit beta [Listeria fleischmannii subsp. coloradonensis]EMG28229.1 DNA polymerase III subunit beta [Listeria fleischmannii subsp. fleischmannii LU2006-1]KMT60039.1 DNA polymerase III subunit beta [Listeria fleischmannii 1991]MBC1398118.1 DNA polymerase III subunit beta [Listeria fleischmannii]MBC1417970.1 DNA polymerase III subunit beta [Listeria fleischmannii]